MSEPKIRPDICYKCGSRNCYVINSRPGLTKRVRRRKCRVCGYRWDAFESLIDPDEIPPILRDRLTQ